MPTIRHKQHPLLAAKAQVTSAAIGSCMASRKPEMQCLAIHAELTTLAVFTAILVPVVTVQAANKATTASATAAAATATEVLLMAAVVVVPQHIAPSRTR